MTVDFANADYTLDSMSTPLNVDSDATFSGRVNATGGSIEPSGPSCSIFGCTASVSGFFAGSNAKNAGLSYQLDESSGRKSIIGAVVFDQAGPGSPIIPAPIP